MHFGAEELSEIFRMRISWEHASRHQRHSSHCCGGCCSLFAGGASRHNVHVALRFCLNAHTHAHIFYKSLLVCFAADLIFHIPAFLNYCIFLPEISESANVSGFLTVATLIPAAAPVEEHNFKLSTPHIFSSKMRLSWLWRQRQV